MRVLLALLLLPAFVLPAAAVQKKVAAAAAEFLRVGAGARAMGMGDAFTAVAEGPEAAYWNPAGLAHSRSLEFGYTRSELAGGLHHDYAALATPVDALGGSLALSLTHLSVEKIDRVDNLNRAQGTFAPHAEVVALSYGREFLTDDPEAGARQYFGQRWETRHDIRVPRERETFELWRGQLAVGGTGKFLTETLGTRRASTFAFDAGAMFKPAPWPELIVAGALRHVGGRMKYISESEPIPAEAAAALAYDKRFEQWRLLTAGEFDLPYAGDPYAKLGVEGSRRLGDGLWASLRMGYNSRTATSLGFTSGLTAGVGLRAGAFTLDAAFQAQAALGQTVRLGVGWRY